MRDPDRRVDDLVRAHLHAQANGVRAPDGLSARIMNAIHAGASASAIDHRLAGALQADAQRVRAPRDMPSRVRNAIRDREARRIRFQPRALIAPAVVILGIVAFMGLVNLLPQGDDEGAVPNSALSGPDDGSVSSDSPDDQSLAKSLPVGALAPGWVPDGYELAEFLKSADALAALTYRLENGGGGYISIEERSGSPPAAAFEAPPITVPDRGQRFEYKAYDGPALRLARQESKATIVFLAGDRTITITANQLSDEELLRLAASMSPRP